MNMLVKDPANRRSIDFKAKDISSVQDVLLEHFPHGCSEPCRHRSLKTSFRMSLIRDLFRQGASQGDFPDLRTDL
jgi:hypothetical protein